jgi:hypothetical protein
MITLAGATDCSTLPPKEPWARKRTANAVAKEFN